MTELTRTLFDRSDLELVRSSPVDPHSLLAARALSIATAAVASVGLLLAPLATSPRCVAMPHWLALYPALIAAGFLGAGIGIMLAMGLFLAVGPRRARLFSQLAATTVGASFVPGRAGGRHAARSNARDGRLLSLAIRDGSDAYRALVWTPVRAAAGDRPAILVWTVLGVSSSRSHALSSANASRRPLWSPSGAPEARGGFGGRTARFGASAGAALRVKERRVVWRDPWLMSQLLLQAAYTMPVAAFSGAAGGRRERSGSPSRRPSSSSPPNSPARFPGSHCPQRRRRIFSRALLSPVAQSNARKSKRSPSRSPSFSPCPSLRSLSLPRGRGCAPFYSAWGRSHQRRWSISGGRRHLGAGWCSAVIRNRSCRTSSSTCSRFLGDRRGSRGDRLLGGVGCARRRSGSSGHELEMGGDGDAGAGLTPAGSEAPQPRFSRADCLGVGAVSPRQRPPRPEGRSESRRLRATSRARLQGLVGARDAGYPFHLT